MLQLPTLAFILKTEISSSVFQKFPPPCSFFSESYYINESYKSISETPYTSLKYRFCLISCALFNHSKTVSNKNDQRKTSLSFCRIWCLQKLKCHWANKSSNSTATVTFKCLRNFVKQGVSFNFMWQYIVISCPVHRLSTVVSYTTTIVQLLDWITIDKHSFG